MPISAISAILKKLKATETITNLPGRGPFFILPLHTMRMMIREVTPPQGSLLENQVSKTTIRRHLHANNLFGRQARKKPFLSFHHKRKRLEFAKHYFYCELFYGQMKQKLSFLATNTVFHNVKM